MPLPRIVELARLLVAQGLSEGDTAIDATVGNGHDTLWLARQVGPRGKVLGLDVQEHALQTTLARLQSARLAGRVLLIKAGHESLGQLIANQHLSDRPRVVMFNLGYLPGADRAIRTQAETTVRALQAAIGLVAPGGLVSAVLYPGHPSGRLESDQALKWIASLPNDRVSVLRCERLGTRLPAPWLLLISSVGEGRSRHEKHVEPSPLSGR